MLFHLRDDLTANRRKDGTSVRSEENVLIHSAVDWVPEVQQNRTLFPLQTLFCML
jgi:hypothetical protein